MVANDGTYLGKITRNRFDSDSIGNQYSQYGSKFSSTSIFNEFGEYGSRFSSQSAFNEFATQPPAIVKGGEILGYLTVNEFLPGAINTWEVVAYIRS